MRIAITGAGGFIGSAVGQSLRVAGHEVVTVRRPYAGEALAGVEAVVHLAGEPVAQRWTAAAKTRIEASRVEGTARLLAAVAASGARPGVFVAASAVGFYGDRADEELSESSPAGDGFLPRSCIAWEQATSRACDAGMRLVQLRIGLVLGPGGALAKMLPAFRLCVGGRLGSGRQWMPWIHRDDLVAMIGEAIANPAWGGVYNAVAGAVTNREFTDTLARLLRRPAVFPVPAFLLRALLGEMSSIVLDSQRVTPARAMVAGFRFTYPDLESALRGTMRQ